MKVDMPLNKETNLFELTTNYGTSTEDQARPGRPGFNPRSSHAKDSKNGT